MFKFIGSIVREMRLTSWPSLKQSYHDFVMVVEYTLFFTLIIMAFDWVLKNGLDGIMKAVAPLVQNLK